MVNIGIYVTTHTQFQVPEVSIYLPMQEGSVLGEPLGYMRDDMGDNISLKNHNYKKLTCLFWIWKNDTEHDIVGLCHHKRFFLSESGGILGKKEIEDLLLWNELIVPPFRKVSGQNLYEQYASNYHKEDLDCLRQAILENEPDYLKEYDEVMNGYETCCDNQMIATAYLLKNFCAWLFLIIMATNYLRKQQMKDQIEAIPVNLLAERLLMIFIKHNNLRVHMCPIGFAQERPFAKEKINEIENLVSFGNYRAAIRTLQTFHETMPSLFTEDEDTFGFLRGIDQILKMRFAEHEMKMFKSIWDSFDTEGLLKKYHYLKDLLYSIPVGQECFEELVKGGYTPYSIAIVLQEDELSLQQQALIYLYLIRNYEREKMESEASFCYQKLQPLRTKIKEEVF